MPKETLEYELLHASKLTNKHRGELAELAFMRKAATLGFSVAKPWGESERYDVVLRAGKVFWRVQVKSVRSKSPNRPYYRVNTTNWLKLPYTADEIDFLFAYIFPEDTWYVFPVSVVENRKVLCITPKSKRSLFEKYREAWKLMGPTCAQSAIEGPAEGHSEAAPPA
jgi:hypothetical protein